MRYLNFKPLDSITSNSSVNSNAIDMSQIVKMSAQVVAGAGTVGGTLQLQVSNDYAPNNLFSDGIFTNWSNLGSAVTVTTAGSTLIAQQDMCYRALRAVWTDTAAGTQTVLVHADVPSARATLVNGNLLLTAVANGPKGNLVKFIINVSGINTPFALSTVGNVITVTAATDGLGTNITSTAFLVAQMNGDGPTAALVTASGTGGIAAGINAFLAGGRSSLNGKYFLLSSATGVNYYVWFNVDTASTDPAIAGLTAVPVAIAGGDSAATVGAALASAVDALATFAATGTTTVTITNSQIGPYTPASDVTTGFTITLTTPSTLAITVELMCLGL